MSVVPKAGEFRNRNVRCAGKSVIRDDRNNPILDEDNARQYKPCGNFAANGTDWCQKHGGGWAPTIIAARRRLLHGAETLVEILHRIAHDETVAPADRIKAINSYLDRAGVRAGVDVNTETPKWQKMIGKMFGGGDAEENFSAFDGDSSGADDSAQDEEADSIPRKGKARKASANPSGPPKFEGW